jgi:hypothetical protein
MQMLRQTCRSGGDIKRLQNRMKKIEGILAADDKVCFDMGVVVRKALNNGYRFELGSSWQALEVAIHRQCMS